MLAARRSRDAKHVGRGGGGGGGAPGMYHYRGSRTRLRDRHFNSEGDDFLWASRMM